MNTSHHLAAAEALLAAVDRGDYDDQLGVSTEHRALLTRANGNDPLTISDVRALNQLGRHDLTDAAHSAGRITLTDQENDR